MLHNKDDSLTLGVNETLYIPQKAVTTSRNIELLSSLKNPSLRYLYLWNNLLTDHDLNSIFKSSWFKQLMAL